jgi:hypothetical protein
MDEELLMLAFKNHREAMVMLVRHVWFVALGAMIAAAAGCSSILGDKLNPAYCAAHPTDPDCRKAFPDAGGCTSSAQCSSPTTVCATDKMACVQCTTTEHDACTGNMPVCGVDDTCRKCSAHTECPSNACLPDGSCGDDTSVAYVDPAGMSTTCTKASPCKKVSDALKTNRPFVKFQGTTNEQVTLNDANVTILADPGAKLTDVMNGILLKIEGASQITIYDLEISGASGANNSGISLQPGNTSTVSIVRAKISGNAGNGISASSGTLTVSRCTINNNSAGGISIAGATFAIMNNFIYKNGNTSDAAAGGLAIGAGVLDASKLEFNTIVDNLAGGGVTNSGGVFCDHAGFIAANNLIFRNMGGAAGNTQTVGLCTYGDSFVSAGASSVDNTPMFAHPNSAPFDYHLTAASPSTIVDAAGACTGVDFDGDTRPMGAACDLGADERKP